MEFREDAIEEFLQNFDKVKEQIRNFEGCLHLELWQGKNNASTVFTHSHWESEEALDNYRYSPLFQSTWAVTKLLFRDRPQAWSLNKYSPNE